jgi:hypothetical protein
VAPPNTSSTPLLRYRDGRPITYRRYDYIWARIGEELPWVATQQITTHRPGPAHCSYGSGSPSVPLWDHVSTLIYPTSDTRGTALPVAFIGPGCSHPPGRMLGVICPTPGSVRP